MVWNGMLGMKIDVGYLGGCRLLYNTVKLVAGSASAPKRAGIFNS